MLTWAIASDERGFSLTVLPKRCFDSDRRREEAGRSKSKHQSKEAGSGGGNGGNGRETFESLTDTVTDPDEETLIFNHGQFELVDYHEFSAIDWGSITWAVDRLIPTVGCGFLAAAPKIGKTWMGLDLCLAVSSGERFLGRLSRTGISAYIGGEGGHQYLQRRLGWLVNGRKLQPSQFAERLFVGVNPSIQLDKLDGDKELRQELDRIQPNLLILDPFTRFHSAKENDRDSVEPVLNRLRRLSEDYQMFVLVVHHAPKPKKDLQYDPLRGTSALRAWHDVLIWMEQPDPDTILINSELRDAEEPPQIGLELTVDEDRESAVVGYFVPGISGGSDQTTILAIQKILQEEGPLSMNDLVKRLGKRKAGVSQIVASMEDTQQVKKVEVTKTRKNGRSYRSEVVQLLEDVWK